MALRDSASAVDVRLERKLEYDHAKQKTKDKILSTPKRYALIEQHVSTSATIVATRLRRGEEVS